MTLAKRIVLASNYYSDVVEYSMETWLKKNCPQKQRLLESLPVLYKEIISSESDEFGDAREKPEFVHADSSAHEAVARMIAVTIERERSLTSYVVKILKKPIPTERIRWYDICTAAGWFLIQTFVREHNAKQEVTN